jgi:hypothetical protein
MGVSMKTYTEPKDMVENPHYAMQRQKSLLDLTMVEIDKPMLEIIRDFRELPYCFTLQCCYGHFLYKGQEDLHNLDRLPLTTSLDRVEYRIAYLALCIEFNEQGRMLMEDLQSITKIDQENIQFCSADWFWKRQVNSYALQVEPDRFKHEDRATLNYQEALRIEKVRDNFISELQELLRKHLT